MANPIDFPTLPTFSRLAAQLAGGGEVRIAPAVVADCSDELRRLPSTDKQRLEERRLIRDDLADKLVLVLRVLADAAEREQVALVVPADDTWRLDAGSRTTECDRDKKCGEAQAVAGKTFALKGGARGCCARWDDVTAVPDEITAFARLTRELLGTSDDAEIGVVVNLDTFEINGQPWPPPPPRVSVD